MFTEHSSFSVVLLAGGVGSRMGSSIPKQYLTLHGKPLALYSFEVLASLPEVKEFVVVCEPQYIPLFQESAQQKNIQVRFALPGKIRQDSVWNGIEQLSETSSLVCIHDAARPMIHSTWIRQVVKEASAIGAAILGVKVKPTIKICDASQMILSTPPRDPLWEAQTPQVMRLDWLKEGFAYVRELGLTVTDDASMMEKIGKPVKMVEGSYTNIKVTTPEDLVIMEYLIQKYALL